MPSSPLGSFRATIKGIEYTRKRMDGLYRRKYLVMRDIDTVYEGLFLRSVTGFEVFLEELLVGILREQVRYRRGMVSARMKPASNEALTAILLQGGKYLNWLPFHNTVDRANIYLKGGKPFTELSEGDRAMIKTITTVRHAIAHKSDYAMSEFRRTVIAHQSLLPRERNPAGFLRSPVRSRPPQNRFQVYVSELARVASDLCRNQIK